MNSKKQYDDPLIQKRTTLLDIQDHLDKAETLLRDNFGDDPVCDLLIILLGDVDREVRNMKRRLREQ